MLVFPAWRGSIENFGKKGSTFNLINFQNNFNFSAECLLEVREKNTPLYGMHWKKHGTTKNWKFI